MAVREYFDQPYERCRELIDRAMRNPFDATDHWRATVEFDGEGRPDYVEKPPSFDQAHETARGVFEFLGENAQFHAVMKATPEAERQRLTYGVAELIRHSEDAHTKKTLGMALEPRRVLQDIEKRLVVRDKVYKAYPDDGTSLQPELMDADEALCEELDEMRPRIRSSLGIRI